MKAFVFPGFDSLEVKSERLLSLQLPEVRKSLNEVEEILKRHHSLDVDLTQFIQSEDDYFNAQLPLKVVSSIAVQVGIFNQWKGREKIEFLIGCSLGDLARTVCAGIVDLESVILAGYEFGESLLTRKRGEIYKVSSKESFKLNDLEESLPEGTHLAVFQTPKHFLIAGKGVEFKGWLQEASEKNYRLQKLADVPLHSPLMKDVAELMKKHIQSAELKKPQYRIFSSVWCREISSANEFAEEMADNIVSKVNWVSSLKIAIEEKQIDEIISLGPASTLLRFSERIDVSKNYFRTDAFKIISHDFSEAIA